MRYKRVLFDLDGTLLDTSRGIYNSVRHAVSVMGLPELSEVQLVRFVGPPPKKMYRETFGLSEADAEQATRLHREYGRTKAILEAEVYDGILPLLKELKEAGCLLGVATLKSQPIAEDILARYGLAQYMDFIVGMDAGETLTKADTLRMCMEDADPADCVLIGDSIYDGEGAKEVGIDFIGALYGFGFRTDADIAPFGVCAREVKDIADLLA